MSGGIRLESGRSWIVGSSAALHVLEAIRGTDDVNSFTELSDQLDRTMGSGLLFLNLEKSSKIELEVISRSIIQSLEAARQRHLPFEERIVELLALLKDDPRIGNDLKLSIEQIISDR